MEATYTDPQTQRNSRVVIHAPVVVAAAGSLETPALLLRSGIGGPAVGTQLRLHPASLVTGIYDEPQDPWFGPAMAGVMNEFAEANEGFGYIIECVQHLPGLFTTVVPWLSGAQQHKELTRKYGYRADWVFIVKNRGAGSVTIDENGQSLHWYPFTDELDRRNFREAAVTSIRMHEAAGAQQIFLAGQPFVPWNRGEDLEAFIEKVNPRSRSARVAPRSSVPTRCAAHSWAATHRRRSRNRMASCTTRPGSGSPTPAECPAVPGSTRCCRSWPSRAAPPRRCSTRIEI